MRISFVVRLCAPLAFISGLSYAETLSADAICRKVAETYKGLRMYQFAAQKTVEFSTHGVNANEESYYALAAVKPDKIRLTYKDRNRELLIVAAGETTWKYMLNTKQFTKESIPTMDEDEDNGQPPSRTETDPLTEAQNVLV